MQEEKIDIEEVKKYLSHQLTPDERSAFDRRLDHDPGLRREFNFWKTMVIAMEEHFDDRLKETLKREDIDNASKQRKLFITPLMVAASLIGVLVISYFLLNYFTKSDLDELFTAYYRPYYNVVDDYKRGNNNINSQGTEGFRFYEQKEYSKAITAFEQKLSKDPNNISVLFYSGLSYLATNQTDLSIKHLTPVASSTHQLAEAAEWYLALAYLKNENIPECKDILKRIADQKGAYKERATSLLQEIH